ncbi:Ig-like domain-containing protein, partial [Roseovarius sp. SYSU LYC5161]|uniref:Ig-like domain-containing protein n=1 Tax=Roseovarius halophilus (ex Wu et al. 2025) TaxID=3376060 RepID=UPI00399B1B24
LSVTTDGTAPTVGLSSNATDPHSGAFTVTATFDERVIGFEVGDVSVGNGTASNLSGSGTSYTFDVTPAADGDVTVDVAADVAEDTATNGNTAATQLSVTTDGTAPTVGLSSNATDPHSGAFTVTATFDEDVTGFEVGDVSVGNGSASNFQATSSKVYTFDVDPSSDGAVTVDIAADVATDDAGNGNTAATQLSVTTDGTAPTVKVEGPTDVVVEDFTVTLTFSEDVTDLALGDVAVTNAQASNLTGSGAVYTLTISPELGQNGTVQVPAGSAEDEAGNQNEASNTYAILAGSPASEFEAHREEIRDIVTTHAQKTSRSQVAANVRLVREARDRFTLSRRQVSDPEGGVRLASRNYTPFDIDGRAEVRGQTFVADGTFFEQDGNYAGTRRRLFFGDFDIQRDEDGNTSGTLSGKLAWEHMLDADRMLGYYVGADLSTATLEGSFEGTQDSFGVNLGGYGVVALSETVFASGFASVGIGRNDLELSNGTLDVQSDYTTQTLTLGGSVTGLIARERYEVWPELAFTHGYTEIGEMDFTADAYERTDDVSLDAGDVSLTTLTLTPQLRVPMDGRSIATSLETATLSPRLICERTVADQTTEECGGGLQLGFTSNSEDGLSRLNSTFSVDRVGDTTRTGVQFKLEHQF